MGSSPAGGRSSPRPWRPGVEMRRGVQLWGAFEPLDLMLFDGQASSPLPAQAPHRRRRRL